MTELAEMTYQNSIPAKPDIWYRKKKKKKEMKFKK